MSVDYAHNARAVRARTLKAAFLFDALVAAGCVDEATARRLTNADRRAAERAARQRPASDETWETVFALLSKYEQEQEAKATGLIVCPLADGCTQAAGHRGPCG